MSSPRNGKTDHATDGTHDGRDDYGRAILLLFELADAARARAARSPHAAPTLNRMAHTFELRAWRLRPADQAEIAQINQELPGQLVFLLGPITSTN